MCVTTLLSYTHASLAHNRSCLVCLTHKGTFLTCLSLMRLSPPSPPQIWQQRPLTEELLQYAASDVKYLHQLYDALNRKLPLSIVAKVRSHCVGGRDVWRAEEPRLQLTSSCPMLRVPLPPGQVSHDRAHHGPRPGQRPARLGSHHRAEE